jgi:hypothetical protein
MASKAIPFQGILDQLTYILYMRQLGTPMSDIKESDYNTEKVKNNAPYKKMFDNMKYKDIHAIILNKPLMDGILSIKEGTPYGQPQVQPYSITMNLFGVISIMPKFLMMFRTCMMQDLKTRIATQRGNNVLFRLINPSVIESAKTEKDKKKVKDQVELSRFIVIYCAMYANLINSERGKTVFNTGTVGAKLTTQTRPDPSKPASATNMPKELDEWFFKFELPTVKINKDDKSQNAPKMLSPRFKLNVFDKDFMKHVVGTDGQVQFIKDARGGFIFLPYMYKGQNPSLENIHEIIKAGSTATCVVEMSKAVSSQSGIHLKVEVQEMNLLISNLAEGQLKEYSAEETLDMMGIDEDDIGMGMSTMSISDMQQSASEAAHNSTTNSENAPVKVGPPSPVTSQHAVSPPLLPPLMQPVLPNLGMTQNMS